METQDFPWVPQPQERQGTYRFDGKFGVTSTVLSDLREEVVAAIFATTFHLVKQNDGLDYLLIFKHRETDQEVWFIDQLNDEMKEAESVEWVKEYNSCMLCYPHER